MDDRYSERTEKPEDKSRQEKRDQKNKKERANDKKRDRSGVVAATVEEAIENAGTQVLSYLESRAHILTVEERKEHLESLQIEGEVFPYSGPYTEEDDARNYWTAYQVEEVIP